MYIVYLMKVAHYIALSQDYICTVYYTCIHNGPVSAKVLHTVSVYSVFKLARRVET